MPKPLPRCIAAGSPVARSPCSVMAMLVAVIAALWVSRTDAAVMDWVVDYWNRSCCWVQGWVT